VVLAFLMLCSLKPFALNGATNEAMITQSLVKVPTVIFAFFNAKCNTLHSLLMVALAVMLSATACPMFVAIVLASNDTDLTAGLTAGLTALVIDLVVILKPFVCYGISEVRQSISNTILLCYYYVKYYVKILS